MYITAQNTVLFETHIRLIFHTQVGVLFHSQHVVIFDGPVGVKNLYSDWCNILYSE